MKTYLLKPGVRQVIAKAGETDIAVAYSAAAWIEEHPAGIPQLMVTTPAGTRVPVTVAVTDGVISGQLPNDLLARPGVYSYVFAWTVAGTQLTGGRCEALVLGSDLARDLTHDARRTPDWAERIFLAADLIEGAVDGVLEARNVAADAAADAEADAEAAQTAREAAEEAKTAAEASASEIGDMLDGMAESVSQAQAAVDGIEAQKDTMIASIASIAGMGTDTTLSQTGVAADANATGDAVGALQSATASTQEVGWYWGTLEKNGTVIATDEGVAPNYTKYSDMIFCPGPITLTQTLSESKYTLVLACSYAADGSLIGERTTVFTGNATTNSGIYTPPAGAVYVRLLRRTFDLETNWSMSCSVKTAAVLDTCQALETRVGALETRIPEYWGTALNSVRAKIRTRDLALEKGDRFFFVTDPHFAAQKNKMSPALISALSDEFQIRLCLMGGDYIKATAASAAAGYEELANYVRAFRNPALRFLATIGNHDVRKAGTPKTQVVSDAGIYNTMMRNTETFARTTGDLTGAYWDNDSSKVRYIQFLYPASKEYDEDVAAWVEARCDEVPKDDGWAIVVMCHSYWDGQSEDGEGGALTPNSSIQWANHLLSLKAARDPIALWLVGHNHLDKYAKLESGDTRLLVVSTTTDNVSTGQIGLDGYARADDTDTEAAFDVIHLDTENHTVHFTRVGGWFVGAGTQPDTGDRAFDYDAAEPLT